MKIAHTLKEIVGKPNIAKFYFVRDKQIFYTVELQDKTVYQFPISFDETKGGTFTCDMPAITLMRWIRKAIEGENLNKIRCR